MDLVVALFERGYSEERIAEAVKECKTLESAIQFLSPGKGSSSTSSTPSPTGVKVKLEQEHPGGSSPSVVVAAPPKRRRAFKKVADPNYLNPAPTTPVIKLERADPPQQQQPQSQPQEQGEIARQESQQQQQPSAEPVEPSASSSAGQGAATASSSSSAKGSTSETGTAAPPAVPISSSSSSAAAAPVPVTISSSSSSSSSSAAAAPVSISSSSSSLGIRPQPMAISISQPVVEISAVAIEARDATNFWQSAAAALWQKGSSGSAHFEAAAASAAAPAGSDEKGEEAAAAAAVAAEEPVPPPPPPFVAADQTTVQKKVRMSEGRLPATPCSASRRDSTDPTVCSPATTSKKLFIETPSASPNAMRLNREEIMCSICCNDVPPCRAVRLGCGHGWYCAQCVRRHSEARLSTGAACVTCPECSTPIAERDLRKLLPPEIIDRMLSRSLEQAVSAAADLRTCPTPNCPMRVALGEEDEVARFKCMLCKKTSCLKCGAQPFHRDMTCEEYQAKAASGKRKRDEGMADLMKWIEETGAKQCPTCKMAVTKQKLEGQNTQYSECHKMICRNCDTRFCFKCLAVLTPSYSCGCSIDAHGFVNPLTGKRINHLRAKKPVAKARGRGAGKAATGRGKR